MNDERKRDVYLGRRLGMKPESKERLNEKLAEQQWSGFCRKCKVKVKGTLEECRSHKCKPETTDE